MYLGCSNMLFLKGWSVLDGAYFCFTSLMTIGFGDFVPGNAYIYNVAETMSEEVAHAKLVLGAVYLLLGMAIIGMCLNLMQEKLFTQVTILSLGMCLITIVLDSFFVGNVSHSVKMSFVSRILLL